MSKICLHSCNLVFCAIICTFLVGYFLPVYSEAAQTLEEKTEQARKKADADWRDAFQVGLCPLPLQIVYGRECLTFASAMPLPRRLD